MITTAVAEELGFPSSNLNWFTEPLYFKAFFYLTQRFGMPYKVDDYKDARVWSFKVKSYAIDIVFNSSWFYFIMFGERRHYDPSSKSPLWVKMRRNASRSDKFIDVLDADRSPYFEILFTEFCAIEGIDESWDQERFDNEKSNNWYEYTVAHNKKIEREGVNEWHTMGDYVNSRTRHALKTLRQFIRQLHVPIEIRDCYYNIKGKCGYEYEHFRDNIKINHIK